MTEEARLNLYELNHEQLAEMVTNWGQPSFRADQIWEWLYRHLVDDFAEMTNLPQPLRERLAAEATLDVLEPVSELRSSDEQTVKILFQLADGQLVETVRMDYERRHTLCISSQSGCAMGCVFCATGQMGFFRNLTAGEIVAQVIFFARRLQAEDARVTNVVLMGMGEPLHNYEQTLAAVDRLTDADGFNLGARKITISTVGLVPAIRRYADEERQTPLALSLHAATDEDRNKLIPINRRWPIEELMDAIRYYIDKTSRRVTIEWALIAGENDTPEQAHKLGELLQGMLVHVNLIPLNPTAEYHGRPSTRDRVDHFQQILAMHGVTSTVRVRRGIDIQAGCGQLRDRVVAERAATTELNE
jgi:23S rRNA (adenine2503-C2)-methyltransferase